MGSRVLAALPGVVAGVCFATSIDCSLSLREMTEKADVVAVAEITAADSENFKTWVYRARITTPIKGVEAKQIIYLGNEEPYQDEERASYKLRRTYVVFLESASTLAQRRTTDSGPWSEDGDDIYYAHACANRTVLPIEHVSDGANWEYRVGMDSTCFKLPEDLDVLVIEKSTVELSQDYWVPEDQLVEALKRYASHE